jgi:hypothetical protein
VILAIGAGLYFTQDRWRGRGPDVVSPGTGLTIWEPLTPEGAQRARVGVESLSGSRGKVFTNLRPGDLAAYIFTALAKSLPPSAKDVRAAVLGDRLYVKALVSLKDLGGSKVLGPLAGLLSPSDTISLGGTFKILRPGMAEFSVQEVKLREFSVPKPVLPKLVQQMRKGPPVEGLSATGLPLEIPTFIGDVRIGKGQVTLYKNVP